MFVCVSFLCVSREQDPNQDFILQESLNEHKNEKKVRIR